MKKFSVFSVFLGTCVEVYDFSIFAFLIPILSEVFFSTQTKDSAINFTILAYVISYAVKPFGSIFFGYLMDRYGRKKIFLLTTVAMTFATSAIALLPPHVLGSHHGLVLIVLRIIQGLSISGEFTSAIIMGVEYSKKRVGFIGSFAFIGGTLGLLLANLSVFILLNYVPHNQMIRDAWRVPFLIGAAFCLLLIYIRNKIDNGSPRGVSVSSPFNHLILTRRYELITTFILSCLSASAFYITFVFMPTLLSSSLKLHTHKQSTLVTLLSLLIYLIALPIGGLLADRIGIFRQIKIAATLYLVFSYIIFYAVPHLSISGCIGIFVLFALIQALLNSALPAFMVTQFQQNQRGKALAISYNMGLSVFAGLMPYLILTSSQYLNPGIPITVCAALGLMILHFKGDKNGHL